MGSNQYKDLIRDSLRILAKHTVTEDTLDLLDEFRKVNLKYRKAWDYLTKYPTHSEGGKDGTKDLKEYEYLLNDIAKGTGVVITFTGIQRNIGDRIKFESSNKPYIRYHRKGIELTALINI